MEGVPWVAVPWNHHYSIGIEKYIPEDGYPTPGILHGSTG